MDPRLQDDIEYDDQDGFDEEEDGVEYVDEEDMDEEGELEGEIEEGMLQLSELSSHIFLLEFGLMAVRHVQRRGGGRSPGDAE